MIELQNPCALVVQSHFTMKIKFWIGVFSNFNFRNVYFVAYFTVAASAMSFSSK